MGLVTGKVNALSARVVDYTYQRLSLPNRSLSNLQLIREVSKNVFAWPTDL